jgi:hypothetical protein
MSSASLELGVENASGERFNVLYVPQRPRPAEKAHAFAVAVTGNDFTGSRCVDVA